MSNDFLRFIEELKKLVDRIKALEQSFLRIRTLVFPTGSGKLQVPKYTADPGDAENGDIWYNSTSHKYKGKENGSIKTFTTT